MASCQTFETNGIGRYQMNEDGYVLDTKEGIMYSSPTQHLGIGYRYNLVTGERAELEKEKTRYNEGVTYKGAS
jgi:hypothetical protein